MRIEIRIKIKTIPVVCSGIVQGVIEICSEGILLEGFQFPVEKVQELPGGVHHRRQEASLTLGYPHENHVFCRPMAIFLP
ncbi:MAG: hypothetical protein ACLSDJ_08605 [Butyricimonas faecihominis]